MPEPEQPQAERQPDPLAADILSSIASHPGLQVQALPDGTEQPANDPAAQNFLADRVPGGQPAPSPEPSSPVQPTMPDAGAAAKPSGGRLFAGKYRSVEEMERAHLEAQSALRDREAENRALKSVNQHLEEVFAPLRQERVRPEPTQPIPVVFDRNNMPVLDPAALDQAILERAQAVAREQVQAYLGPLTAMSQANARLKASYPESVQLEGEFTDWLKANPEYRERVTQDPEFALEGAFLKFERERGFAVQAQSRETAQAAQAQTSQARAHASPAGGSPVAQHRPQEADGTAAALNKLYKYGQETGNWKPYQKARLEMAIGPEFLGVLEKTNWGR